MYLTIIDNTYTPRIIVAAVPTKVENELKRTGEAIDENEAADQWLADTYGMSSLQDYEWMITDEEPPIILDR